MCRVVSARLKKFNVDQDRRGPRHYDDSDFLPHRHKAPTLAKKAGPEPQEKQPGQPPPSKLTAHYTPVSLICNSRVARD
jgi:hypothetical protein